MVEVGRVSASGSAKSIRMSKPLGAAHAHVFNQLTEYLTCKKLTTRLRLVGNQFDKLVSNTTWMLISSCSRLIAMFT